MLRQGLCEKPIQPECGREDRTSGRETEEEPGSLFGPCFWQVCLPRSARGVGHWPRSDAGGLCAHSPKTPMMPLGRTPQDALSAAWSSGLFLRSFGFLFVCHSWGLSGEGLVRARVRGPDLAPLQRLPRVSSALCPCCVRDSPSSHRKAPAPPCTPTQLP